MVSPASPGCIFAPVATRPGLATVPSRVPRSSPTTKLPRVVAALRDEYGSQPPPPARTAFALILWEKVAYLATDAKRTAAFRELERRVGLTPNDILAAKPAVLQQIAALGGAVGIVERAQRMQDAAALVSEAFNGTLDTVCTLPAAEAKRELQRFYGIAEPGAERILLLLRAHRTLPLESNGLRVMVRLGYAEEDRNYSRMYRAASEAARSEIVDDFDWLIDAHLLLRRHGQEVCKTSAPRCEVCTLRADCAYAAARRGAAPVKRR